jgi:hypothetical protein
MLIDAGVFRHESDLCRFLTLALVALPMCLIAWHVTSVGSIVVSEADECTLNARDKCNKLM